MKPTNTRLVARFRLKPQTSYDELRGLADAVWGLGGPRYICWFAAEGERDASTWRHNASVWDVIQGVREGALLK